MNLKRFAGPAVILVLLGGLYLFNRSDVELSKQDSYNIISLGKDGLELTSDLHLNNPNLLSATIKTIDERYTINGRPVAIFSMEVAQGIPGRKETTLPVSVRFSRADVQQFLPDSAVGTTKALLTVTGKIEFSNMFGGGTITVNQQDSIDISL